MVTPVQGKSSSSGEYDEVPYPSRARGWTHPDRLAAVATLFGMTPPTLETARVLELGCGDGSNLMGIAFHNPAATVVGVDIAAAPLARGRALAAHLGLKNLELHHAEVSEYYPSEKFDFVIAYGLFSWVPEAVRTRILEICRDALSENGLAYINYNAYPGWHLRRLVRDLMIFHVDGIETAVDKHASAVDIASWLAQAAGDDAYGELIRREVRDIEACDAHHIYHDDLCSLNRPMYLHEFLSSAARYGLQYVGDADSVLGATDRGEGSKVPRQAGGDLIRGEQYLDFLHARRLRQSILCRCGITLDRSLTAPPLQRLHVASSMPSGPEQPDGTRQFRLRDDCTISTNQPWVKNFLTKLAAAWPGTVAISEFEGWQEQGDTILRLFAAQALRLRATPVRAPRRGGERPVLCALNRAEIAAGARFATNPYHFMVDMGSPFLRTLGPLLDGSRDRTALVREMASAARAGRYTPEIADQPLETSLPSQIETALDGLGASGLLSA